MKKLIHFELKRRLRSSIFIIVILVLIIAIVMDMGKANTLRDSRPFGDYPVSLTTNSYDWIATETEKRKAAYPKAVESFDLFSKTVKQREQVAFEDDYIEYARLSSFRMLLTYKLYGVGNSEMSEAGVEKVIGDIWKDVSGGVPFDSVDFRPFSSLYSDRLGTYLTAARFYQRIYKNELRIEYTDENTTASVVYRYLDDVLPIALLFLGIFFSFQSINKEKENGSLKLLITQSMHRSKIYIAKWISGVIQIMTALFIPIFIVFAAIFIKTGNSGLKYPLPYLQGIFSRVVPIANYAMTSEGGEPATLATRGIGHIATSVPMTNIWIFHPDVSYMSLAGYIVSIFILTLFFTAFIVAFVQLISTIINNTQLSLAATLSSMGVIILLSIPFTHGERINVSPFTLFRPTRIIEGLYNITPLTSIIILFFSTVILMTIGSHIFKRKAI